MLATWTSPSAADRLQRASVVIHRRLYMAGRLKCISVLPQVSMEGGKGEATR